MPSGLFYGQWGKYNAENPRLKTPISSAATTIVITNALEDEDGSAVTGSFIMGIKNSDGYVENVWVPAASSTDGETFTSCVRGIDMSGLDYTTQNTSSNAVDHEAGEPVSVIVSGVNFSLMLGALQGTIASGGNNWKIGDGTDSDITIYAYNADGNRPFWRYDASENGWYFSNNGVDSTPFGTGAGVTGGDGITVTAGDIDIDLTDTVIFRQSRNGNEARGVVTETATGLIANNFMRTNLQGIDTGTTNITGTELETLSDGSQAGTLHTHDVKTGGGTASIDASANTDVVVTTVGTPTLIELRVWGTCNNDNAGYTGGSFVYFANMIFEGATLTSMERVLQNVSGVWNTPDDCYGGGVRLVTTSNSIFGAAPAANGHQFLITIESVSATGFTIRFDDTETGAVAAQNVQYTYKAWT